MAYSKYSKKQKKLAAVANPKKKITRADFKKIMKRKKTWLYSVILLESGKEGPKKTNGWLLLWLFFLR